MNCRDNRRDTSVTFLSVVWLVLMQETAKHGPYGVTVGSEDLALPVGPYGEPVTLHKKLQKVVV